MHAVSLVFTYYKNAIAVTVAVSTLLVGLAQSGKASSVKKILALVIAKNFAGRPSGNLPKSFRFPFMQFGRKIGQRLNFVYVCVCVSVCS